jgi:hypothetical protein
MLSRSAIKLATRRHIWQTHGIYMAILFPCFPPFRFQNCCVTADIPDETLQLVRQLMIHAVLTNVTAEFIIPMRIFHMASLIL